MMPDREKVIRELEELSGFLFKEYGKAQAEEANLYYDRFLAVDNAIGLLKEQEAHEQAICKEICDFIRHACSTDTDDDKDYVCYVIQKCFTHFCADGERRMDDA